MRIGKAYTFPEFLRWTRRSLYLVAALSVLPAILHEVAGVDWLVVPWGVVFMLGTTVALSAGFKTLQTYNRMLDAQQAWSSIVGTSRVWGNQCRDLVAGASEARTLVYRHFAWLAALRHELRRVMAWETAHTSYNAEYLRDIAIVEHAESLRDELARYVSPDDGADILSSRNPVRRALDLQSRATKRLLDDRAVSAGAFADLQHTLRDLQDLQARVERIKQFPYPRQHAIVNTLFVRILCVILPFGVVGEFARLDDVVGGWAKGHMIWIGVALSVLISWMYASLDQVGESTENPFEGGANDVPITAICADIEADVREMLGEVETPRVAVREPAIAL
jgi:ion channel-forming bestrophin family protein